MDNSKIRSFTDLNAWREAHKLVLMIYKITSKFPKEEAFGLTIQMRKAVVSITSNIAEGFSRRYANEKGQFYTISLGSNSELQNQLLVSKDVHYITQEEYLSCKNQSIKVQKLINGLIKSSTNKPKP